MALGDGCAPGSGLAGISYQSPTPVALTDSVAPSQNPVGPSLHGEIEFTSGGPLLSGFVARIWLQSGPGPTYTDEVVLVELAGAQAAGTIVTGNRPLTTNLPIAGRPFDWTRDHIRFEINAQYTASSGTPTTIRFTSCSAAGGLNDCCAELSAKLDEVLAAVSKRYFTQP